ncbi:hypothetical protein M404DRAFT_1009308 [Pisolithus tinctorius Marx 270]|uniref:Uncharacterized protein n=1 Tax=Pisolithus tinctorius Marx 270 TaxID=870435 RepID=A0A0C3MVE6_PISTI|nr:hypothetical protein M404DRAFT_1009308 [Pisolithus tinctorius Marx 270]
MIGTLQKYVGVMPTIVAYASSSTSSRGPSGKDAVIVGQPSVDVANKRPTCPLLESIQKERTLHPQIRVRDCLS